MPICKGARLKVERADHHIAELESRVEFLKQRLAVSAHVNPDTGCEFIKCDFTSIEDREAFDRLPVFIGDAVHNLKCALDYVWLDTVQRLIPSGEWERTKFPIYPTPELLERELRKLEIDVSAPMFFRFILSKVQPYDGGDFAIRPIHIVDTGDKHRLLTPVIHYSSIDGIRVEQNGVIHHGFTAATTDPPPVYVPFAEGIHIKDPGQSAFAVMFQEGNTGSEKREVDTLRVYSCYIARTVRLFEDFVEA